MEKQTASKRFNPFRTRSESSQNRSKTFRKRSADRSRPFREPFPERSWNEKAARNAENERCVLAKKVANAILLSACFTATLTEQPWNVQICYYLGALAMFFATDPLDAMTRFLAPQSRNIMAVIAAMAILVIICPEKSIITIIGLLVTAGVTAIKFMNSTWLASYNWLMSAEAQKALRIDPDDTAAKAWQAHGRRETRTLLYEMGFDANDNILDILHRPVYLCGYLNGFQKTVNYEKQLQTAQEAAERGKEYKEKCEQLQKVDQERAVELREIRQRLQEAECSASYWQKMYQQEEKMNQKLQEANEVLVSDLPDPVEVVEQKENIRQLKEQTVEEKVMCALEAGMSLSEAGKAAGVSKSTAYRIKQQMEQVKEQDNVITIGKIAEG